MIYFDNSATTQTLPEAAERACIAMTKEYYNPAAAYGAAFSVEKNVTEARSFAASLLGAAQNEIIYTSGGTESNNAAVFGALRCVHGKKTIVTTAIEHPSVYETVSAAVRMLGQELASFPLVFTMEEMVPFISTPKKVPNTLPTPPVSSVPPMTAEEMASISSPVAWETEPAIVLRQ